MRKIKSGRVKTSIIILLFSLVITSAFVVMLLLFSGVFSGTSDQTAIPYYAESQNLYTLALSDKDAALLFGEGNYTLSPENVVPISVYNQSYFEYLIRRILPYAALFCLFLIIMSVILWIVLRQLQEKYNMLVVKQLNNITDIESFSGDTPALIHAYESIKQKFDEHLTDYKRLNSYLSHEQKNAISILRTRIELSDNHEYLPALDAISQSIDDLLTLSEASDSAATAPVDVALVCAAVCDSYRNMQSNISFTFDENADTVILAKERWIYRAVANLVSNAVKYGNGKPVEVQVANKKHSVIVTVKDYGIGISAENQEKIFNHRYRINELNKDGYGIGLSLVSHVCDLCGGFAAVESTNNEGSVFYLSFPEKIF